MNKVKNLNDIAAVSRYLSRIGAEPRSLRTAVIKEQRGAYWKDIAVITIQKNGDVRCPDEYAPTEVELALIKEECEKAQWPELNKIQNLINLPPMLNDADKEDLYIFRDEEGLIVMVQQRIENKEGGKAYVPWTYWDDGEWRRMEPEGKLPLYGIEQVKEHNVVFIHEGAKAARKMQKLIAAETVQEKEEKKRHPWGKELSNAAHIGWIGGALSPARTDWSKINKLGAKKVFIVSDNDEPGISAVPAIAYFLRVPTFHIQFTNEWPASFDLADDFPEAMFKEMNGYRHYIGPSFRTCTHPATWATDKIPNPTGKGKPTTALRDSFKSQWAYVEEADLFVNTEMPEILRSQEVLNKMLSSFSHVANTTSLIVKSYSGRKTKLCYRPDTKGRIVSDDGTSAVNLHRPTEIKPVNGDPQPWIDFLKYMFPVDEERKAAERWCATLIACPDVKMEYGLLLVSETQGIGKTTLGARVLAPLVGSHNSSFPSEREIVDSSFNGWLAGKRLVVVNEIYSGHSWKAYNQLKGYVTDREIVINEKFVKPYQLENWAHFIACSNSSMAMKIETDDRRWFYPAITEVPWSKEQFIKFYGWLDSGGLAIIRFWAESYSSYVSVGDRAPMTHRKVGLISSSRSDALKAAIELSESMNEVEAPMAIFSHDLRKWLGEQTQSRVFDQPQTIHNAMKAHNVTSGDTISIKGRKGVVLVNKFAKLEADAINCIVDRKEYLRKLSLKTICELSGM